MTIITMVETFTNLACQDSISMQATFLDPAQRKWLHERQAAALRAATNTGCADVLCALREQRLWQVASGSACGTSMVEIFTNLACEDSISMQATFLDPAQREWLHERQATALRAATNAGRADVLRALRDRRLWHLAAISLVSNIPKYGA